MNKEFQNFFNIIIGKKNIIIQLYILVKFKIHLL